MIEHLQHISWYSVVFAITVVLLLTDMICLQVNDRALECLGLAFGLQGMLGGLSKFS